MRNISHHIFLIDDFLPFAECDRLISESEGMGYEYATIETEKGAVRLESVRNNSRVLYTDMALADWLWFKLKDSVPQKIGISNAVGLNELFRFYKYEPGHQFKKHIDNSFIRNESEASYYTFMIYLNDDYSGGETSFKDVEVKGKKGMALVFLHSLEHEGKQVREGIKYVLRSDIMYRLSEQN
jgi:predicted 2-oxoglutarate/Fe(II)-dependent dioxygenase YbiX